MLYKLIKKTVNKVDQPSPGGAGKDFLEKITHSAGGLSRGNRSDYISAEIQKKGP